MTPHDPPWATGPGELLRHGLDLLHRDSDSNRRFAMIAIDNAVELMIKTYLGLPRRVTGIPLSRKEYQDISESFPALLDAIEKHAAAKLSGVDVGEIEWYHRLRNQLYHQGNGLTVERKKVEIYAELANILFSNLFGSPAVAVNSPTLPFAQFLVNWSLLEKAMIAKASEDPVPGRPVSNSAEAARQLRSAGHISINDEVDLRDMRDVRNRVAHGEPAAEQQITRDLVQKLNALLERFGTPSQGG